MCRCKILQVICSRFCKICSTSNPFPHESNLRSHISYARYSIKGIDPEVALIITNGISPSTNLNHIELDKPQKLMLYAIHHNRCTILEKKTKTTPLECAALYLQYFRSNKVLIVTESDSEIIKVQKQSFSLLIVGQTNRSLEHHKYGRNQSIPSRHCYL